ncbi:MAG: ribose ABC transporter substrate-binding protein [[Clostridium] innocuum]|nr:ribose ABC transporter substrate-binding protein [[Clostridium] innocuum]MBS5685839.1 ribose ABC transporter substrate-binding protein [[Clostridium] innocuum]
MIEGRFGEIYKEHRVRKVYDLEQQMKRSDFDFEKEMKKCNKLGIKIKMCGKEVEADWLLKVKDQIMLMHYTKLKRAQRRGIDEALQKKLEGLGGYGRPRVELPEDFGVEIQRRLENKESLSEYCRDLQLSKSTFYKWAKIYKDAMAEDKEIQ